MRSWILGLCCCSAFGCVGTAELQGAGSGADAPISLPPGATPGVSGARRLSAAEYDATVEDLLADRSHSGYAGLPADVNDPFDNDYRSQLPSASLIEGVETLAATAAARALADLGKRDYLVQCQPTGPGDAACFRKFVTTFGRRALRRPLSEGEVQGYLGLQAFSIEAKDFYFGVNLAIRAFLQDVEFLYRVEVGAEVAGTPGLRRLTAFELASRLSYFLWGSTPPDWLLDGAQAGQLDSPAQVRAAATRLLADPKARARVERFHALWLGYHRLPHPIALTQALQAESAALVDKVVFDQPADYFSIFRSTQTYANDLLLAHYGLPQAPTGGFQWVDYGASGRQGILSHGAVLSAGAKFSDTSPTQRGIFVRNRLLCQEVPPPPPSVNVDAAPQNPSSPCKADRYASHASTGNCKSCHQNLDPIGFGLENYDQAGRYRTTDLNQPTCAIKGDGAISGVGDFHGPAGLENLLIQSGALEACVVKQVYRFAMGRRELPPDEALLDRLTTGFVSKDRPFGALLLDLASDETFAFRIDEGVGP